MKLKPSWAWFEVGLLVLSLALHLWVALSPLETLLGWYESDDAFYYFKVAQNITSGLGMTFDGLNRTNGFHPLWMAVCVAVFWTARFDLVLPLRLLVIVSALFNAGTALLLFRLLRKFVSKEAAATMGVLWCFLPAIHDVVAQLGLETVVSAFFLTLLLYLAAKWRQDQICWRKAVVMGFVAGLAILARLDNVFVVLLFGVWFSLRKATAYLRTSVAGDLALVFISGLLSYFLRLDNRFEYIQNSMSLPWLVGVGFLVKPAIFLAFRLYTLAERKISWMFIGRVLAASTLSSFLVGAVLVGFQSLKIYSALSRAVILYDFLLTTVGILLIRLLAHLAFAKETQVEHPSLRAWGDWKSVLQCASGYYLPAVGLLVTYMTLNHFYVGSVMPVSGQVKHWWGGLNTIYGPPPKEPMQILGFLGDDGAWRLVSALFECLERTLEAFTHPELAQAVTLAAIVLCALAVLFLFFTQRKWALGKLEELGMFVIFAGLYAQIFSYTATAYVHIRQWYWSGELIFSVLCFGILAELIATALRKSRRGLIAWRVVLAVVSSLCIFSSVQMVYSLVTSTDVQRESRSLLAEVEFLERNAPPGAKIGVTGGGTVAYFLEGCIVVNLDGLINSPEYFSMMKAGQGAAYLDKLGLDYIYGSEYKLTHSAPYQNMLAGRLEQLVEMRDEKYLYRYLPGGD